MLSTETRKFILRVILLFVYSNRYAYGCNSNQQLYTEIGCKPIFDGDSTSCPVAYNCENVFARPSDKCYFNGNAYEPTAHLSNADSLKAPCLAACFCGQHPTVANTTETKFTCANVECPAYFTRLREPCYYQYDKDQCCEVKTYCPEEKALVHECLYDNETYKDGQRFYVGDHLQCVCSPEFNGTVSDRSCRQVGCNYELLYMDNILERSAPVYFDKIDGCPIEWFHPKHDVATAVVETTPPGGATSGVRQSGNHECKYGDKSFSLGQQLTIGQPADSDTYKTTCFCNTPPLVTCIKVRIENA